MPADRGLAHSKFACESNLGFSTQDNSLQKPSVVIRECLQGQPCCSAFFRTDILLVIR